MCAQFMIRANLRKLAERFGVTLTEEMERVYQETSRVLPYGKAPIILNRDTARIIEPMQFSLVPSWSKERRVKFATHNARLETVDDKPTWKRVFTERRCLVPITDFIEPIYNGDYAGHMVRFHPVSDRILAAAGLWDEWINPADGEVIRSFTILTSNPLPFVRKVGHDRSPVFIQDRFFDEWLEPGKRSPAQLKSQLLANLAEFELSVEKDRPLKAGWEKRR